MYEQCTDTPRTTLAALYKLLRDVSHFLTVLMQAHQHSWMQVPHIINENYVCTSAAIINHVFVMM